MEVANLTVPAEIELTVNAEMWNCRAADES